MIPVPAHLQGYVAILGPDLTVDFLLAFGGAELYLSRSPGSMSRLAQVVGPEKAAELAAAADQMRFPRRVPTGKEWIARRLSGKGLPVAEIARMLHTTDVTVRKYLQVGRTKRAAPDYRQMPLF